MDVSFSSLVASTSSSPPRPSSESISGGNEESAADRTLTSSPQRKDRDLFCRFTGASRRRRQCMYYVHVSRTVNSELP